ncbi:melanopsin-like [Nematostella vectensis]|uniref:melanopsin-like n=1 Tax=Nematostella vectensis TaxID=45351 RepID=UPI002076EE6A|nr:melanopsin-like [Nematostella vectensis]XP_048576689.1 melanopsin-like [Nematostella vectensis]XP_048576690.1 melanopsin-like [Nematostella vectensis]
MTKSVTNASSTGSDDHVSRIWMYGTPMFLILALGVVGNGLAIAVLFRKQHRNKIIVPFMINIAMADMFIVVASYPVFIYDNIFRYPVNDFNYRCVWYGLSNCCIGMASIGSYALISVLVYKTIASNPMQKNNGLSVRFRNVLLVAIWIYGILCALPPLLGWNLYIRGPEGLSCGPVWVTRRADYIAYNITLVVVGFVVPVSIMGFSYFKVLRFFFKQGLPNHNILRASWALYQRRVACMVGLSSAAFLLSWSPYCFVSVASMATGEHVLAASTAMFPELMAKASVIYNPMVYTAMDTGFRKGLVKMLGFKKERYVVNLPKGRN